MSHIYKDDSLADALEFFKSVTEDLTDMLRTSGEEDRHQAFDRVISEAIRDLEDLRPTLPF